jgi:PPM family protein phosphatase
MEFKVGTATDIGKKRAQNQDNFASDPEMGLFVVADGMGGHRGGETASAMAAEIVATVIKKTEKDKRPPGTLITEAIRTANKSIFERASKDVDLQGMGTTTTALFFHDETLFIGHVGDSRCYYIRPHAIWQATRDHSLVQEKLRAGLITRAEVKTDRMKNVITRSVGFEPDVNVEVYEMPVRPGDIFLICSDGLSGLIEEDKMLEVVQKNWIEGHDPQKAVNGLIEEANNNGGDDNITVIVVEVVKTDAK